jgi:hypothetical protein
MANTGTLAAHNFYKKMRLRGSNFRSATTLVETVVATALIAAFFATIFEVNGVCLRYINSSKEGIAALQGVHNRLESLRNLLFTDLTSSSYLQNLMVTPADVPPACASDPGCDATTYSDFVSNKVTEVVTLSAYPTPDATNTQITRGPGASVTPTINSTDTNLASAALVKANVTFTWTSTLGGRARSEQTEIIISAGTKKSP